MTPRPDNAYDLVPYESHAVPLTAPGHLALTSLLAGGPRPRGEAFHMLELGCAEGANLLALAYHDPASRFVGLDHSAAHIATARTAAEALGLTNLRFLHGDLQGGAALDALLDGPFDYIAAHGVYSWIPAQARRALLDLCRRQLAPDGIAYVSYNTMPGWALRGLMRDLALRAAGDATDPTERWRRARAAAKSLRAVIPDEGDDWLRLMAFELDKVTAASLSYMTHEYLTPDNAPFYLHEFVAAARAAGLGYVGDAMNLRHEEPLSRHAYEALEATGAPPLEVEQQGDLLRRRCFRAALLCQGERAQGPPPDASVVEDLWVAACLAAPAGPPQLLPGVVERFRGVGGVELGVADTLAKAAFRVLAGEYPSALRLRDLGARAVRLIEAHDFTVEPPDPPLDGLASDLRTLYLRGQVELRLRQPQLRVTPGPRPRATALALHEVSASAASPPRSTIAWRWIRSSAWWSACSTARTRPRRSSASW